MAQRTFCTCQSTRTCTSVGCSDVNAKDSLHALFVRFAVLSERGALKVSRWTASTHDCTVRAAVHFHTGKVNSG